MKLNAAIVLFGTFAVLVIGAIIILSTRPAELGPMDANLLANNPMPVIRDQSIVPNMESNLPVLAAAMPDFQGISKWWNTENGEPLTASDLRGKVVMVDFWTYSCINCIRTQPFMRKVWETYKDDGLVIVGVHTPEFAFEKVPANVEEAIRKAKLEYPIALDAEFATWNAYGNRYWPAAYFFDRQGRLRFTHFGEGEYDEQEQVIRQLLQEGGQLADQPTGIDPTPKFNLTKTHETYFGSLRFKNLENLDQYRPDGVVEYQLRDVTSDHWSLGGAWKITPEYAVGLKAGSRFRMSVESDAMHLVLGSMDGEKRVQIRVDGKVKETILVKEKQLYTIANFPEAGRHLVELELLDDGVEFYAATFGMIVSVCSPDLLALHSQLGLKGEICKPTIIR